jgi:hypothetical protein
MSSNFADDDRLWQCKCSSVALDPALVADQSQLTSYDGDRPCNHPIAATGSGAGNGNNQVRSSSAPRSPDIELTLPEARACGIQS